MRISFLFKNADIPYEKIDPEQLMKVSNFKKSAGDKGLFYRQYADQSELITSLRIIFDKIANEKQRYLLKGGAVENVLQENDSSESGIEDQDGLFEFEDKIQSAALVLNKNLGEWGEKFIEINEAVTDATTKIAGESQFGTPDRMIVRGAVDAVTAVLSEFEEFGKERIDGIEDSLEDIIVSLNGIIGINENQGPSESSENLKSLTELRKTLTITSMQVQGYIKALSAIPRIDKKFARARDGVVIVHKRLLKKLRDFSNRLDLLYTK